MKEPFNTYLRRERRKYGLSQGDLACILGIQSRSFISMLEQGERSPSADQMLALKLLFGAEDAYLFPALYHRIQRGFKSNIVRLLAQDHSQSPMAKARRELLHRAIKNVELDGVVSKPSL